MNMYNVCYPRQFPPLFFYAVYTRTFVLLIAQLCARLPKRCHLVTDRSFWHSAPERLEVGSSEKFSFEIPTLVFDAASVKCIRMQTLAG